jgi:hypothetical protein
MSSFSIVKSHPDMLKYLVGLQSKNSHALGFLPKAAYERGIEAGQVFLGLLNGEPCGFVFVGSGYQGTLRRWQVCLQYDVRRRLYGAQLVAASEAYGEEKGCTWSEVRCAADLEANEFWKSVGYRYLRNEAGGLARGRLINIWHKKLNPEVPATSWAIGRRRLYSDNAARQRAYRARLAVRGHFVTSGCLS